ncbi:MAG TPA: LapA family protein [Parvularculaceae bacterium]|nr:DUF1049 domain-containing protein [Amphiplicatus sp.]MCB9955172.1 DUF1049 domain-containing protein [Caulobacterales bacterium]HOP18549.1 LapA family protein [Amphiplicatus sp.]HPE30630.1 LapA family protein [Parvularculaceae bacterium]HRX39524.1 LapA family protein [Parvularculaceae bacterium]
MKKIVSRLIWIPVGALAVLFFFANRRPVAISLDPISMDHPAIATPALPLWFWLAIFLLIGFFAGAAGMWASGRPARRKARAEIKALKSQLQAAPPSQPAAGANDSLPTLKAS